MNCTRCEGTGFLNIEQVSADIVNLGHEAVLAWIEEMDNAAKSIGGCSCHIKPPCSYCTDTQHDVSVCDCCGNGEEWYGEPGQHDWNNPDDPKGCR